MLHLSSTVPCRSGIVASTLVAVTSFLTSITTAAVTTVSTSTHYDGWPNDLRMDVEEGNGEISKEVADQLLMDFNLDPIPPVRQDYKELPPNKMNTGQKQFTVGLSKRKHNSLSLHQSRAGSQPPTFLFKIPPSATSISAPPATLSTHSSSGLHSYNPFRAASSLDYTSSSTSSFPPICSTQAALISPSTVTTPISSPLPGPSSTQAPSSAPHTVHVSSPVTVPSSVADLPLSITPHRLPLPESYVPPLSRHIGSKQFHLHKSAFFNRSAASGLFPSFTLPTFQGDFYKNLAHTHNIRFHEDVSALRKEICSIMAEHHNNQAAEEQARVDQINSDIGELYPQSVVRLINTNAKRKAAELNNSRPAANNQRNRQSRGRGGGRGRGPARNRSLRNGR